MSEQVETPVRESAPGSLRSRMRARTQELEQQRTEIFPVPGYAELLAVELMPLGWERMQKIRERIAEMRDPSITPAMKQLYVAADELIAATVKFYEINDDGGRREIDDTWKSLAEAGIENFPQDASARQAVLALINKPSAPLLMPFYHQWGEWMTSERVSITDEVGRDFETTR